MNDDLQDDSIMPFGKYQGQLMQDVPASYLHWLWVNGVKDDKTTPIHRYIEKSLSALKQEFPDGIWK